MSRAADAFVAAFGGAVLSASAALALLARRGVDPIGGVDLCWSRILLGRACPGCGLTRSFVALAGGDLGRAAACNPTGPVLFAAILLLTILHGLRLAGVPLRRLGAIDAVMAAVALAALVAHGFHFLAV